MFVWLIIWIPDGTFAIRGNICVQWPSKWVARAELGPLLKEAVFAPLYVLASFVKSKLPIDAPSGLSLLPHPLNSISFRMYNVRTEYIEYRIEYI